MRDPAPLLRLIRIKFGCYPTGFLTRPYGNGCQNGPGPRDHFGSASKGCGNRGIVDQRCRHHRLHYNRYFESVRDSGDFRGREQEHGVAVREGVGVATEVTSSRASSASKKTANNYTINIFYNDPKKQHRKADADGQPEKPPKEDQRVRHENRAPREPSTIANEKHYNDALRHILLLHLLKDRTFLERSFKRFLEEDLKDMDPVRAHLLRDYLLTKSSSIKEEAAATDRHRHQEDSVRTTVEHNKMAFVREALDLCDSIINDRDVESEPTPTPTLDAEDAEQRRPGLKKGLSDEQMAAVHRAVGDQYVGREGGVARTRRPKEPPPTAEVVAGQAEILEAEEEAKKAAEASGGRGRFKRIVCRRRGFLPKCTEVDAEDVDVGKEEPSGTTSKMFARGDDDDDEGGEDENKGKENEARIAAPTKAI